MSTEDSTPNQRKESHETLVEEVIIGGRPATHRTHWQCDVDERNEPVPPASAEDAQDIMHSWEVDGLVIVEHDFESDEPLVDLEDLLAAARWAQ